MQPNKRILFTDLDGTLLNDEKKISPGNRAAIDEALAMGHAIVINTGRPLVSVLTLADQLGFSGEGCYVIAWNGGQIYDLGRQESIYSRIIPLSLVRPLFDAAAGKGIHIQTYNNTNVLSEHDNIIFRDYERFTGVARRVVNNITDVLTEGPHKLLAISYKSHECLTDFQRDVLSAYSGTLTSFFSSDTYLEIVPDGVSKGSAIQWMCGHLGIPLENTVAAGDAQNDISMLEAAHVGAVMCNAFPGVAEHGDYITEADNNHDGLAEIIYRFILS